MHVFPPAPAGTCRHATEGLLAVARLWSQLVIDETPVKSGGSCGMEESVLGSCVTTRHVHVLQLLLLAVPHIQAVRWRFSHTSSKHRRAAGEGAGAHRLQICLVAMLNPPERWVWSWLLGLFYNAKLWVGNTLFSWKPEALTMTDLFRRYTIITGWGSEFHSHLLIELSPLCDPPLIRCWQQRFLWLFPPQLQWGVIFSCRSRNNAVSLTFFPLKARSSN